MDIKEIQHKNPKAERHPWELARVEIIKSFIKKVTRGYNPANISIIDFGCGDLFVLEQIYDAFKFDEVFGIDDALNSEDIKIIKSQYLGRKFNVLNSINDVIINKNNFSIVLLNDVIEHIQDDNRFLISLHEQSFVNENTVFIFTVPAFQFLFCSHDTFLEHYRRYSNHQLTNLLKSTNYSICSGGYFFSVLIFPRFIKVMKERYFGIRKNKEFHQSDLMNWNGNKILSGFIKNVLLFDYWITSILSKLKIKIPGLSIYAICKKSAS